MTIAQRLYVLIFAAVVGLASLAGFGMVQMDRIYTATNFANINTVPSLLTLDEAFSGFAQVRLRVWQSMAQTDAVKKAALERQMEVAHASLVTALNKYEQKNIADDKDRDLLAADRVALGEADALHDKV